MYDQFPNHAYGGARTDAQRDAYVDGRRAARELETSTHGPSREMALLRLSIASIACPFAAADHALRQLRRRAPLDADRADPGGFLDVQEALLWRSLDESRHRRDALDGEDDRSSEGVRQELDVLAARCLTGLGEIALEAAGCAPLARARFEDAVRLADDPLAHWRLCELALTDDAPSGDPSLPAFHARAALRARLADAAPEMGRAARALLRRIEAASACPEDLEAEVRLLANPSLRRLSA